MKKNEGIGIWCTPIPTLWVYLLPLGIFPRLIHPLVYLPLKRDMGPEIPILPERTCNQRYPQLSGEQTDTCENTTFPQLRWLVVKKLKLTCCFNVTSFALDHVRSDIKNNFSSKETLNIDRYHSYSFKFVSVVILSIANSTPAVVLFFNFNPFFQLMVRL